MLYRIYSILALLAASAAALAADPKITITNFAVADAITSVQLCGNRNQGSKKAQQPYRVLLGMQGGQSVLFVQWMNQPDDAEHWRGVAAHTLGFSEINDDQADLSLSNLRCSTQGKAIKITANVAGGPTTSKSSQSSKGRQMLLNVGPELEKYEIKFTPPLK